MNWLIITDENNQEKLQNLVHDNFYGSVIYSCSTKKKDIEKIVGIMDSITNFVFYGEKLFSLSQFISGFFCGKNIPCFFIELEDEGLLSSFEKCCFFNDIAEFESYIEKNRDELIEESELINEDETEDFEVVESGFDEFSRVILNGDFGKACEFISNGFSVDCKDKEGTPLLNLAVRKGKIESVKFLLDKNADINCVSLDRGYTPLMDAIFCGFDEIAIYLSSVKGCDTNIVSKEGQTAIILAVGADKTKVSKALCENNADVDYPDEMGMSAYGYASLFKKTDIMAVLEKYHKE